MQYKSTFHFTALKVIPFCFACLLGSNSFAADHQEAPTASAQKSADIGDYYAWHADGMVNAVLTFGPFNAPGMPANYDSSVLYAVHFDTSETPDGVSDFDLYVRFAQDTDGNWGIRLSDTDDNALVAGSVESVLVDGDVSAWAGLADDPFFFDQTGFNETVTTGTIAFNPERDDVAGLNITTIAIQLPIDTVKTDGGTFKTWATTSTL